MSPMGQETHTDSNSGDYNLPQIGDLLRAAFTPPDLRRFCRNNRDFRFLAERFGPSANLEDMIDVIIEQCSARVLFPEFLEAVRLDNPKQYARFVDRLFLPREQLTKQPVVPPVPVSQGEAVSPKAGHAPDQDGSLLDRTEFARSRHKLGSERPHFVGRNQFLTKYAFRNVSTIVRQLASEFREQLPTLDCSPAVAG